MKFVVIGGDAAGMSGASRAKRNRPDLEVTVFEQTQDVSYSACGMPYNIADAARPIGELVVREAQVFRDKQGIDLRTGHRVAEIDRGAGKVRGRDESGRAFEASYDRLLIATGASPIRPDRPGFDLPGVLVLKSLGDGRRIKEYLEERRVKKAVVVGMGYIAMEMAEALKARGIGVCMVKPRPRLLPWMTDELSELVQQNLEAHGVELIFGQDPQAVEQTPDGLRVVCPDMNLDCQVVIVAIGVRPNSELAAQAGLDLSVSNAISTDKTTATSDPNIFSAGDCADAFHVVTGKKTWVPLALRANRAGWAAADNVLGQKTELAGVAGTAAFKVFELQVARTGLSLSEAEKAGFQPAEVVITSSTKGHTYPGASEIRVSMVGDKATGRLLGAQMVGEEGPAHRINAAAVALHAGLSVADFGQVDLAYAPPFGPTFSPLIVTANQLLKKL